MTEGPYDLLHIITYAVTQSEKQKQTKKMKDVLQYTSPSSLPTSLVTVLSCQNTLYIAITNKTTTTIHD